MNNNEENNINMTSEENKKEVENTNVLNPHQVYDAALSRIEGSTNTETATQNTTATPVEKVNCPNCGVPIKKDIALCPFCGKPIK